MDVAIGAAYAGKRAFTSMKHVGLNVAADAFMYASMTGLEAGLVIVTADDPAMHSSQSEQDNRTFAKFARIPCLEPSDSQEAKDMMIAAFGLGDDPGERRAGQRGAGRGLSGQADRGARHVAARRQRDELRSLGADGSLLGQSLRGAAPSAKQSPSCARDCFAKGARNDTRPQREMHPAPSRMFPSS
jgi:hypothetical protein